MVSDLTDLESAILTGLGARTITKDQWRFDLPHGVYAYAVLGHYDHFESSRTWTCHVEDSEVAFSSESLAESLTEMFTWNSVFALRLELAMNSIRQDLNAVLKDPT